MSTVGSTRSISRSTFLRSGIALSGGALGVGLLGTGVQAAPAAADTTRLPKSWSDSVFAQSLPGELDGYVASFTTLYTTSNVSSLSAKKIAGADGFRNFLPEGTDTETEEFSPHVSGTAHLDGGPVEVLFVGSAGTEVMGEVQLVRTADHLVRGLLLHVLGTSGWSIDLPAKTPIVESLARVDSPAQVTKKAATAMLAEAVGKSFYPEGDNPATVDRVQVLDDGQHILGRVSYPYNGENRVHTWYGTAVGGDGGWDFLFGQLPES